MNKLKADAFFAGVGGIELGFTETGSVEIVYANEFDKNARKTYALNHPDTPLDGRDIRKVEASEIPDCDIIMGGFPCQTFSVAGKREGFNDARGTLFFEMLRMIKAKKPSVVFAENVKNLVTHDGGHTFNVIKASLEEAGYAVKWKVLNAKDYGNLPQNRERIYIVAFKNPAAAEKFEFPGEVPLTKQLDQYIDFDEAKAEKYYYRSGKQPFFETLKAGVTRQDTLYQWRRWYIRENKSGVCPALTANMGTGGHNVPILLTDSGEIRKLTPHESFCLQGFPEDFKLPVIATGQLYKQAGNSVAVPVIRRIAEKIILALEEDNKKIIKQDCNNTGE